MADVYLATDWKGLNQWGTIAVMSVEYYAKPVQAISGRDPKRFDSRYVEPRFEVNHMERYRHMNYPEVIKRMERELAMNEMFSRKDVCIILGINDAGAAIEYILEDCEIEPEFMHISSNSSISKYSQHSNMYTVPRNELILSLATTYQKGQIKVAKSLKLLPVLDNELVNLKLRSDTGVMINRNTEEKGFSDVATAVAMCIWMAKQDHERDKTYADRLDDEFGKAKQATKWPVYKGR